MSNYFTGCPKVLSDGTFPSLNSPPYPQTKVGKKQDITALLLPRKAGLCGGQGVSPSRSQRGTVLVWYMDKARKIISTRDTTRIISQRSFSVWKHTFILLGGAFHTDQAPPQKKKAQKKGTLGQVTWLTPTMATNKGLFQMVPGKLVSPQKLNLGISSTLGKEKKKVFVKMMEDR